MPVKSFRGYFQYKQFLKISGTLVPQCVHKIMGRLQTSSLPDKTGRKQSFPTGLFNFPLIFYDTSSLYSPCRFPIPSFSGAGQLLLLRFAGSTAQDKSVQHDSFVCCIWCSLLRCLVSSPYISGNRLKTETKTWCILSLSSEIRL